MTTIPPCCPHLQCRGRQHRAPRADVCTSRAASHGPARTGLLTPDMLPPAAQPGMSPFRGASTPSQPRLSPLLDPLPPMPFLDPDIDRTSTVATPTSMTVGSVVMATLVASHPHPPRTVAYSRWVRSASTMVTASRRSAQLDAARPVRSGAPSIAERAEIQAAVRNLE